MKSHLLLGVAAVFAGAAGACAQGVQQNGSVTPGHAVSWTTSGVIQDAGVSTAGAITSLGITSSALPSLGIATNGTGTANTLNFGVEPGTGGFIDLENPGTTTLPLIIENNGNQAITISGTGVVTIPSLTFPGNVLTNGTLSGKTTNSGTISGGILSNNVVTGALIGSAINTGVIGNTLGTISGGIFDGGTLADTTTNSGIISGGTVFGATLTGTTTNSGTITGGSLTGGTFTGVMTNSGSITGGLLVNSVLTGALIESAINTGLISNLLGTISGGTITGSTLAGALTNSGTITGGIIYPTTQTSATASGTNQGTAAQLAAQNAIVTTCSANQGVILLPGTAGLTGHVLNECGATITLYPNGSNTINGGSAGVGVALTNGQWGLYIFNSGTAAFAKVI